MKFCIAFCALLYFLVPLCYCNPANYLRRRRSPIIYVVENNDLENRTECELSMSEIWSYDFHECFIDRKYSDGGKDLEKIVDRIMEHSRVCVGESKKDCRPDMAGFITIMAKVIGQMKDYSEMYLEDIHVGRDKIKDLACVEESLSTNTYINCFRSVFAAENSEERFEEHVDKAISCADESNEKCSKAAKTTLNRIVRIILNSKKTEGKSTDYEPDYYEPAPTEPPPRPWYDYIFQPFRYVWNAMRSFFGSIFG